MSLGYILRLPCKTYGNFSVEKQGFMLNGHVLMSLEVWTVRECEQHCLRHPGCSSINWKIPASGFANCQINDKSAENSYDNVMLSPSSEWTYKTTNYTERNKDFVTGGGIASAIRAFDMLSLIGELCQALKPCKTPETCMDSCDCPGYDCQTTNLGK
eukprot:gene503-10183_t